MSDQETLLLDALPYVDKDLEVHPNLQALVDAEIAKETRRFKPTPIDSDPRIPPDITLFASNSILSAEMERIKNNQTLSALDGARYQLPTPPEGASEEQWGKAVKNAEAQLEHQNGRQINIALLQTYGANAWKVHNYLLESSTTKFEKAAEELKEKVTEVNRGRKNSQIQIGKELNSLEARWTELISNVLQIELANVALEQEVESLRQQELDME